MTAALTTSEQLRHFCRNLRCRSKLAAPVTNRNTAFCSRGCHAGFYRARCVVCERACTPQRAVCTRKECRSAARQFPHIFPAAGSFPSSCTIDSKSARKTGLKTRPATGRPWRIVAGPAAAAINLQIEIDAGTSARQERDRAAVEEHRRKAKRAAGRKALLKRRHPPVNVLNGFKFSDAPAIDLSPTAAPIPRIFAANLRKEA